MERDVALYFDIESSQSVELLQVAFVRIKIATTPTSTFLLNLIVTHFLILFQYIIFIVIITTRNE